jgi:hypothetical protein
MMTMDQGMQAAVDVTTSKNVSCRKLGVELDTYVLACQWLHIFNHVDLERFSMTQSY